MVLTNRVKMSNTKFTKGEWKVYGDWGVSYGENKFIAEASGDVGSEERFYNLRLISAAPDLYEALRCFATGEGLPPGQTIEGILAKARGES